MTLKMSVSVERLCERVEFRDVPIKCFVRNFQNFESIFKTKFKIREHMLPGANTPLPLLAKILTPYG
jgi:hypothetical protein